MICVHDGKFPRWMGRVLYILNTIGAVALVTQGAETSAIMVLAYFSRNISVSAPEFDFRSFRHAMYTQMCFAHGCYVCTSSTVYMSISLQVSCKWVTRNTKGICNWKWNLVISVFNIYCLRFWILTPRRVAIVFQCILYVCLFDDPGPLLLRCINFDLSMDK